MALDQVINFGKVTVSLGYGVGATSIALTAGHGARLPNAASGQYNLVWWNSTDYPDPSDDPNVEIIRVTAGGGNGSNTLTVSRAQEGTSASSKDTLGKVYKMILAITAKMIADIETEIPAAQSLAMITVTGSLPGTVFTAAQSHTGNSFIVNSNTIFIEGVDYTCSGTTVTWLYTLPDQYSTSMILICLG